MNGVWSGKQGGHMWTGSGVIIFISIFWLVVLQEEQGNIFYIEMNRRVLNIRNTYANSKYFFHYSFKWDGIASAL